MVKSACILKIKVTVKRTNLGGVNFLPTYSGRSYLCVVYSNGLEHRQVGHVGLNVSSTPWELVLIPKPDPRVPQTLCGCSISSSTTVSSGDRQPDHAISLALPGWS